MNKGLNKQLPFTSFNITLSQLSLKSCHNYVLPRTEEAKKLQVYRFSNVPLLLGLLDTPGYPLL